MSDCSFCELPEITGEALAEEIHDVGIKGDIEPFYKQYRCLFGFVAQMCYWFVLCLSYAKKTHLYIQWRPSRCWLVLLASESILIVLTNMSLLRTS